MNKKLFGACLTFSSTACLLLILLSVTKVFPDVTFNQALGYLTIVSLFLIALSIIGIITFAGGITEEVKQTKDIKTQEVKAPAESDIDSKIERLRKKWGLTEEEAEEWRAAEEERKRNPKGRSLDL